MKKEYLHILECAGHGFWDWNPITHRITFSEQWAHLLGFEKEELTQTMEDWISRIHPDDYSRCFNELAALLGGRISHFRSQHRLLCKDGTYRWVLNQAKVVEKNAHGYSQRVVGTLTDIDELKTALEFYKNGSQQSTVDTYITSQKKASF